MNRAKNAALVIGVGAALAACAAVTAIQTHKPLDPAAVAADMANAKYYLASVGCVLDAAAGAAAPLIQIAGDAQGNQILTAVDAAGKIACQMAVPPVALPVPAPANTPAA